MWFGEYMVSVEKVISKYNLINSGDIIGVACSGGADSMSLLHYLNSIKDQLNFKVVAITVDHGIRESSDKDAEFVVNYCNKHSIKVYKYKGKVRELSETNGQTLEQAAREFRFKIFNELLAKKEITKVALGHHMQDQAETIMLNIFRGSGLQGAGGMDLVRDNVFLRPLLKTSKSEIMAYINANEIPYVEDETNQSNEYARNYIRNLIMPLIRNKWKNADSIICNFGETCKQDDEFIYKHIYDDMIFTENNGTVKIPVSYFVYDESIVNRIILKAVKSIGVLSDVERKHINLMKAFALESENGTRINLPNKLQVLKEYNFITITNKDFKPIAKKWPFKIGKTDVTQFGVIEVAKLKKFSIGDYKHLVDVKKVPKDAVWRFRQDGDTFEKFGGGTKSLSDYLTDIKVPRRLRNNLPVLAVDNEILVVAGFEIRNKVRLDEATKTAYGINPVPFE
jgi:tRNA(Ile)-lysidine synthase